MKKLAFYVRAIPFLLFFTSVFILEGARSGGIIVFLVLTHEIGHIAVILIMGEITEFSVRSGAMMIKSRATIPYLYETAIILGGPLMNMTTAIISHFMGPEEIFHEIFLGSLVFATVNMLPIKTLDGGRVFYIAMLSVFSDSTAFAISDFISLFLSFLLVFTALYLLFRTGGYIYLVFFAFLCCYRHLISRNC